MSVPADGNVGLLLLWGDVSGWVRMYVGDEREVNCAERWPCLVGSGGDLFLSIYSAEEILRMGGPTGYEARDPDGDSAAGP